MSEKTKKTVVTKEQTLSEDYKKELENEHGLILETITKEFINKFFNLNGISGGKDLYYDAFFMLKKGFYPRKYIYIILYIQFKKVFKKYNMYQLQGYEDFFAKTTLNNAVARYCKNKPYEINTYAQYYQPEGFFKKIKRQIRQFYRKKTDKY